MYFIYNSLIACTYSASVGKSVHIGTARIRASKNCLMTELCFYYFLHFDCVPIYLFDFHHKQCASD